MEMKELRKMIGSRPQPPRKGPWGQDRKLPTTPPVDTLLKSSCKEGDSGCHASPPGRREHEEPLQGAGLETFGGPAELLCGEGRGLALMPSRAPMGSSNQAFRKASADSPLSRDRSSILVLLQG